MADISPKAYRATGIAAMLALCGLAAGLVLFALRDSVVYFHAPSALLADTAITGGDAPPRTIRVGGLVVEGSVEIDGVQNRFAVSDGAAEVVIEFTGALPDLFREGQGIIAEGVYDRTGGVFRADSVLAKHDETYMPKEVADALKKQGLWKPE